MSILIALYIRLAERIIEPCTATVYVHEMQAMGWFEDNEIHLNQNLTREELMATVYHESYHCIDKGEYEGFGVEPYVNNYAKTNAREDIAETYAYYKMGYEIPRAKKRALCNIIDCKIYLH